MPTCRAITCRTSAAPVPWSGYRPTLRAAAAASSPPIARSHKPLVDVFKTNLKGRGARDQAMVLVALCVGGMVLARALDDKNLAKDFLDTAHKHALKTTGWRDGRA